jgi:predicted aspartyl protease
MKYKIPIEIFAFEQGYHLFVDAKINNEIIKMVLDTGASKTVFDFNKIKQYYSHKINYQLNDFPSVGIGTNNLETFSFIIPEILIGKLKIENFPTVLIDMNIINESYIKLNLPEIIGILGSDILVEYNSVIDMKNKILKFEIF